MRKQVKPFATEYKSRRAPKPPALFDDADFVTEERPARDINEDLADQHNGSYEAALRAADAIFGNSSKAKQEVVAQEPANEPKKRILTDLTYVDPLEARLAVAPSRRGRKPGSKNRPKEPIAMPVIEIAAPTPAAAPPRPTTQIVFRRRAPGFIDNMRMQRSVKPGERWKWRMKSTKRVSPRSPA